MNISTAILAKYREFDRDAESKTDQVINLAGIYRRDLDKMTADIKTNGVKAPGVLLIHNGKALLVDGNNRLACCIRVGLESMPIEVQHYDKLPEDSYKLYLGDKLPKMVDVDFSLYYAIKKVNF